MFPGKSTVEHAKQLSTDLAKVTNSTIFNSFFNS